MNKVIFIFMIILLVFGYVGTVVGKDNVIKISEKDVLGKYLVDSEGMTLYWFKKDSPGKSVCTGGCLEKWPIFYRENIEVSKGMKKEDFGTIIRDDGKKQSTFKGYPLYYWINDKKPGDTNGHEVNNVWFVINPNNFPSK